MPDVLITWMILLLPLTAFAVLGLWGKKIFPPLAGWIGTFLIAATTVIAFVIAYEYFTLYGKSGDNYRYILVSSLSWLELTPSLSINLGVTLDPIAVMMLVVVTLVSLMVHIYSLSYMKGEERFATYYAYLGLFTFSMLGLVLSSNLFQIYMFWELVGLSSFLLIGFYYNKPSAVAASKKAFIVTRFADLGFLIGILILSNYADTLDFQALIQNLSTPDAKEMKTALTASFLGISGLTWGLSLVFMGAAGKSAMIPLHIWLPDAMEGPTPVSALIHAATMVVAGVFLVARLFPVFALGAPDALSMITWIGVVSALMAALIACTQTDIKRVLAYSTMSQIGFMMFALGISGYGGTEGLGFSGAMFHLFTHAIFKALLFLGAGAVIHFVHSNELHDMGGLRKYLPVTHITFLIACLAIAGVPPFAGFFSKEWILMAAHEQSLPVYWIALFTSAITAFYMFRLYFSIFWNKPASYHTAHGEGEWAMLVPLVLLATGAVVAGFVPFGKYVSSDGKALMPEMHFAFAAVPVALSAVGIAVAAWFYIKPSDAPKKMADAAGGIYRLVARKFYVDELYLFITHRVMFNVIGQFAAWFDRQVIDKLVALTGEGTLLLAGKIKTMQSGKVQLYAAWFLAGIIVLVIMFVYLWK